MKPGPRTKTTERQDADALMSATAEAVNGPRGVTPEPVVQKKRYTHEETMALIVRAQQGDVGARNAIVLANQGLVGAVVSCWRRGVDPSTLEEMRSECTFALFRAIEKFDVTSGNRFSTYAYYWLKAKVGRTREKEQLAVRAGRQGAKLTRLDAVVDDDDNMTLKDLVVDEAPGPREALLATEVSGTVQRQLDTLFETRQDGPWKKPERARAILVRRLMNDSPATLAEVGRDWGLTREAVRQYEGQLVARLRESLVP